MSRLVVGAASLADHCHASLPKKSSHERCTKLRAEYAIVACAELPGSELIAASARAFASHALRTWDCSVLLDRVVLVVSELATNALLHGFGWRETESGKTVFARWDLPADTDGEGRAADPAATDAEAVCP